MSADQPPYNPVYIKAWALLSIVISFFLLGLFIFGDHLIRAGHIVWILLRWLNSPII